MDKQTAREFINSNRLSLLNSADIDELKYFRTWHKAQLSLFAIMGFITMAEYNDFIEEADKVYSDKYDEMV